MALKFGKDYKIYSAMLDKRFLIFVTLHKNIPNYILKTKQPMNFKLNVLKLGYNIDHSLISMTR